MRKNSASHPGPFATIIADCARKAREQLRADFEQYMEFLKHTPVKNFHSQTRWYLLAEGQPAARATGKGWGPY